jgi:AraC-like DNA-binding protein
VAYNYQKLFTEIDKIVSANPGIHLKDLAQQLQYSHPVIEKATIKHTGLSFRNYKNNKILEQSLNLWNHGYCVKHIGLELGYKWPDNFSRFVKNKTGLSVSKLNRSILDSMPLNFKK